AGGKTDGQVLGAVSTRSAVAHPLTRTRMRGLSCGHLHDSVLVLDDEDALQHEGEFVELGPLARFGPARWAVHVGDAHSRLVRVDPTHVLLDQFWRFTGRGDPGGRLDELWHERNLLTPSIRPPNGSPSATAQGLQGHRF